MKQSITTLISVFFFILASGQQIISGDYDMGLKLAYDSSLNKVTGYFENYTGWDEENNSPRFSCIFYIEGTITGPRFSIKTYYPAEKKNDVIEGTMEIGANKEVKIKLPEEHGGCWNVQHFADEPVEFVLEKRQKWLQVRYVNVAKTFFYNEKLEAKRTRSYLVDGDFVLVERIEQDWIYCAYLGKNMVHGWLKLSDVNKL